MVLYGNIAMKVKNTVEAKAATSRRNVLVEIMKIIRDEYPEAKQLPLNFVEIKAR